jgi:LuxR family transcriptional regulator, maltose regulon positive regulatory protein
LIDTKLQAPILPEELVRRKRLIDIARDNPRCKLVLVSAPAGYGKTTFLAEWRDREQETTPFAWVSLDQNDRDPKRLCAYVIEAVDRIEPGFGDDLRALLHSPGIDFSDVLLPRLVNALAGLSRRIVLVFDDYHVLERNRSNNPTDFVLEHLPQTVQLVIATRADPTIFLGRLRASGEMIEIRAKDLLFDEDEAASLLTETLGFELKRENLENLLKRTEGWPAGLYLAALSLKGHPDPSEAIRDFVGNERHLIDYLTEEVLERQSPEVKRFLLRTSVLERLTAPLCDAVVGEDNSSPMLERLERSNLFVVPLDERREWYRYHHLFADLLETELSAEEPEIIVELHRRAGGWFEEQGWVEEAVDHAIAAGDLEVAAELMAMHWASLFESGLDETLHGWVRALGNEKMVSHPLLALTAARTSAISGDREGLEFWLDVAERGSYEGPLPDGHASLFSATAMLRARFAPCDLSTEREAVLRAVELEEAADSPWRAANNAILALILYVSGDLDAAVSRIEHAFAVSGGTPALGKVGILAWQGVYACDQERVEEAEALACRARDLSLEHGIDEHVEICSSVCLAFGRSLEELGRVAEAEAELLRGLRSLRNLEDTRTHTTILLLLALARVRIIRGDLAGAGEAADIAGDLIEGCVDPGIFPSKLEHVERAMRRTRRTNGKVSVKLTSREREVLAMLPSGLSQREIGEALYLSFNTVHTHARAVYRKLGASSRDEAVQRARLLGIISR